MISLQNISWKKVAIIIGFAGVTILIGYAIYYLFFRAAPAPEIPGAEEIPYGQLPSGVTGKPGEAIPPTEPVGPALPVTRVTQVAGEVPFVPDAVAIGGVTSVTDIDYGKTTKITIASTGKDILSYNPESGMFYEITEDGEKVQMTDRIYKDVQNVAWSPQKEQAILEFPDGSNILYNFKTDKQISLPKDWTDFNFNKEGSQIAFKDMNANPDYRWLAIANADGSGQKYIEPIGDRANDFKVDWSPNGKMVAQYITGNSGDTSKVYFVGQNDENFRSITVNGYGVETKWTPDGSRLLYSAHNYESGHKPELYIVDASGDNNGYNHQSINLNTWPDKCTFSDAQTVYCAVPKDLPENVDFLPEMADNIPDYIYKVDLTTGVKSFIAEPEYDYTIDQIVVSDDGENLYFTDKQNQNLHTIRLK
ncbi:hypothetical protein KKC32_01325 [Patescibacteria group bacterium]|nr:hypothetical protein [Patescibacteria group bacterium]